MSPLERWVRRTARPSPSWIALGAAFALGGVVGWWIGPRRHAEAKEDGDAAAEMPQSEALPFDTSDVIGSVVISSAVATESFGDVIDELSSIEEGEVVSGAGGQTNRGTRKASG